MTYISSQSLLSSVRQSVLQAQAGLAQAQAEVASGNQADLGLALGARTGSTISLANEADALNGYAASNAVASTRLSTTANTLEAMVSTAQSMAKSLLAATTAGGSSSGLQASAQAALQSLASGLNTTIAGQYVFGGINSGVQPLADFFAAAPSSAKQAVDGAFSQTFGFTPTGSGASTIGAGAMTDFLNGAFADQFNDANWSANWSKASDTTLGGKIAPGQTATTSVSANDGAFRQITQAYAMLSEFTGATMSADAKAAVVAKATTLVNAGLAALNDTQAAVGISQAAVSAADDANSAQATLLKSHVSGLESVDTLALSNRVTVLQTQLQASYELTSRLQSLSLVNYLNG